MEWLDKGNSDWEESSEANSAEELLVEEEFPEGRTYPLNSKRLVFGQLQAVAKKLAVELPTGALTEETWKLIEGRLLELEREPWNI